jgi:uncharacterized protein with NAD-binding domain and iron-sulfur cluster
MSGEVDPARRIKVAVLGGGMGALAAAWQLQRLDRERYDITVYQRGWRLGGKAASGRNRQPGQGLRIEEHGLHILMGFYDHVFHLLRTCYDELGPAPDDCDQGAIGTWAEALTGSDHLHVCDRYRDGQRAIWELRLPVHGHQLPGTAPPHDPDVAGWIGHGLSFIYQLIQQGDPRAPVDGPAMRWLRHLVRGLMGRQSRRARLRAELLGQLTRTSLRWAMGHLFRRLGDPESRDPAAVLRRRQAMAAYFVGAHLLGMMNNGLHSKQDFLRYAERIDHLDYREWLRQQTAPIGADLPELAWDSALVRAVYDLIFSQSSGFGAGTALYDTLNMLLSYRGHVYYRMNGGMGDVVFAPLYLWLRRQGVKFRFFQRVRRLHLEPGAPSRIGHITLEQQVDLAGGEYDPLFPAAGRACWPNAPLDERLPASERRRLQAGGYDLESGSEPVGKLHQLRRGRDFDLVVLGIPVGAFQHESELVGELTAAHRPFAEMVAGIGTASTRAFQVWTDRDAPALGWNRQAAMLGAYERPFGSWADMTQVLPQEDWEAGRVKGVHYFCGVDETARENAAPGVHAEHHRVRRDAIDWMQSCLPGLLPNWSWERACAPAGLGPQRFAAQYWRANSAPSERYVLAVPGSLRFRLAADRSGFENLFLAGDWVRTDLNAGCLEAAAMAGVAAGRAIHQRMNEQALAPVRAEPAARRQGRRLPAYVDRDSDWVLRAPVQAREVVSALFLLRADPAKLAAVCASEIDRPSAGQVTARPWPARAGLVMLLCSQIPRIGSGDEAHAAVGTFAEQDVGFFVPVALASGKRRRGLGLLAPYLFVDSAIGLSAGREIYGFSKLLARIDMPAAVAGRGFCRLPRVTVSADVLAAEPAARVQRQQVVLEVVPGGARARRLTPVRLLPALTGALARLHPGPGFQLPLVFLKQFRDAAAPAWACHQSLVRCGAQVSLAARPRALPGTFLVRLPHHGKPDLAGTLGLSAEMETTLALELEHDLYLPAGQQLWP